MLRRIVILFFLFFNFIFLGARDVSFQKEHLDIIVYDSSCTLEGRYFLENNANRNLRVPIYYPIAVDSSQAFPAEIIVKDEDGQPIKYRQDDTGISFSVKLPADTISSIFIHYEQNIKQNRFEYIVESTKNWGEPLQKAIINIHVPRNYRLSSTSFPYKKVKKGEDKLIYIIEKEDFYPDKNVIIKWKVK